MYYRPPTKLEWLREPSQTRTGRGGMTTGVMAVGLALALAVPLGGCVGKIRMEVRKMCLAHGGTWSTQSQQCTYSASTRSGADICEGHGGTWEPAGAGSCFIFEDR